MPLLLVVVEACRLRYSHTFLLSFLFCEWTGFTYLFNLVFLSSFSCHRFCFYSSFSPLVDFHLFSECFSSQFLLSLLFYFFFSFSSFFYSTCHTPSSTPLPSPFPSLSLHSVFFTPFLFPTHTHRNHSHWSTSTFQPHPHSLAPIPLKHHLLLTLL